MTCGIYLITNTVTGDRYVGQSVDIDRRWRSHVNGMSQAIRRREAGLSSSTNLLIQALAIKHGLSTFKFEMLEDCCSETLSAKEAYWVAELEPSLNRAAIYVDPATGKHPTTIARLKSQDTLPEIGNAAIEEIRLAITELSKERFGICPLSELLHLDEDQP